MAPSVPTDVTNILARSDLDTITAQYNPTTLGVLFGSPAVQYAGIAPLLQGIGDTVYPELKSPPGTAGPLAAANRERCLVALLASRTRHLELALHLYMALANGVAAAELAQIVALTGAYCGVDTATMSLTVMQGTLAALKDLAVKQTADPKSVLLALSAAFPS